MRIADRVEFTARAPPRNDVLASMMATLSCQGPDDETTWNNVDTRFGHLGTGNGNALTVRCTELVAGKC